MNKFIWVLVVIIILVGGYFMFNKNLGNTNEVVSGGDEAIMDAGMVKVDPIEHATMVLTWGDVVIYNDPVGGVEKFSNKAPANIVLVTDIHGDHLDVETLKGVVMDEAVLITSKAVMDELPDDLAARAVVLSYGDYVREFGITITAFPAYNFPESDEAYHIKGRGNGYILEKDGYKLYIAGDTSGTPEMSELTDVDMAFIPMNLPYTMSVEDAAEAVLAFAPKKVYPYHYRGTNGLSDVGKFKQLVEERNSEIEVVLLEWYPEAE